MKTLLSEKQSQNLIDFGIPKSEASMDSWQKIRDARGNPLSEEEMKLSFRHGISSKSSALSLGLEAFSHKPIFSLSDLFQIIPNTIKYKDSLYFLNIRKSIKKEEFIITYINSFGRKLEVFPDEVNGSSLIMTLYNSLVYLLKHKLYGTTEKK